MTGLTPSGRRLARAEDAVGQRALGGHAGLPRKDLGILLPVDRDGDRLAQGAVLDLLLRRRALADDRIEHVEADVVAPDIVEAIEPESLAVVFLAHLVGIALLDHVRHAGVRALAHLEVVVALAELVAFGHLLAFDRQHDLVDERRPLAAVVQQARFLVAGLAFARIRFAAVVRIAHHHLAAILEVFGLHVRPGADRPGVERQVGQRHAGLRVELVGLPRHRGHEGHRHPVAPLRVLAQDAHTQRVLVGRRGAGQRELAEIEERQVGVGRIETLAKLRILLPDQLAVVLQPDDVPGEHAEDGGRDARRRVALQCIDVVVRDELARALPEFHRRGAMAELARLHRMVEVVAAVVLGEARVRLEQDARLDLDVVDGLRDLVARSVVGQILAVAVDVARLGDVLGGLAYQLVRALQVLIAVGRLVDLVGERRVVVPVRGRRVEVARRLLPHRGEQRVARLGVALPRAVVAARQQQREPAAAMPLQ